MDTSFKAKDSTLKAKAEAKDSTLKAKTEAKDLKIVLEDPRGRGLVLEDSNTGHLISRLSQPKQ